jgi:hypothetical protein
VSPFGVDSVFEGFVILGFSSPGDIGAIVRQFAGFGKKNICVFVKSQAYS